jgi:hypothetical protein
MECPKRSEDLNRKADINVAERHGTIKPDTALSKDNA